MFQDKPWCRFLSYKVILNQCGRTRSWSSPSIKLFTDNVFEYREANSAHSELDISFNETHVLFDRKAGMKE